MQKLPRPALNRAIQLGLALAEFWLQVRVGQTMLRFTSRQRTMLIEEIPGVANLVLGTTFLGQFLGDRPFSLLLALAGVGAWATLAVLAFVLAAND